MTLLTLAATLGLALVSTMIIVGALAYSGRTIRPVSLSPLETVRAAHQIAALELATIPYRERYSAACAVLRAESELARRPTLAQRVSDSARIARIRLAHAVAPSDLALAPTRFTITL